MASHTVRTLSGLGLALAVAACGDDNLGPTTCDLFSNLIFDGGVGRDGIPALTTPDIGTEEDEDLLRPDDRVLGVVINGTARAYPFFVMWWHEIVNDTLGGEPVLVSYCPLTGSGLAFDPRVNGELRNFGVSGLIFENNLMMFDRGTESLWPQLLLGARCGPERGAELRRIPVVETTWEAWKTAHPTSTVVTTNTGFNRDYGVYPYGNYDVPSNTRTLFPSSPFTATRPPKELVLGVAEGTDAVAYPTGVLEAMGTVAVVNDTVGGRPIVVTYDARSNTPVAFDARADGQTLTFAPGAADDTVLEDAETGSQWTTWGVAVSGPLAGTRLRQVTDAFPVFWFAWEVFYPETRLVQ